MKSSRQDHHVSEVIGTAAVIDTVVTDVEAIATEEIITTAGISPTEALMVPMEAPTAGMVATAQPLGPRIARRLLLLIARLMLLTMLLSMPSTTGPIPTRRMVVMPSKFSLTRELDVLIF